MSESVAAQFSFIIKKTPTNKVSPSPPVKKKKRNSQTKVAFLTQVKWQEMMPLIANKKLHYYSIQMNIKVQNIGHTCPLIIRTYVIVLFA